MTPGCVWLTPPAPGAVSVLCVRGLGQSDAARLGLSGVPVGACLLRGFLGVDRALAARWEDTSFLVMPHGGLAVSQAINSALVGAGLHLGGTAGFPAAGLEARVADALARATSPLAVDLLLDQPRRWSTWSPGSPMADAAKLARLLNPPRVVVVGAANIGKSSLLNRLAGASVALAFDQPGTTRDAVGVLVDLAGLVVRWVDTPGLTSGDAEAQRIVRGEVERADLVLACADHDGAYPDPKFTGPGPCHARLRCDLSRADSAAGEFRTSSREEKGLEELVAAIRRSFVPDEVLASPLPWRFWES